MLTVRGFCKPEALQVMRGSPVRSHIGRLYCSATGNGLFSLSLAISYRPIPVTASQRDDAACGPPLGCEEVNTTESCL